MAYEARRVYAVTFTATVAPNVSKDFSKTVPAVSAFEALEKVKAEAVAHYDEYYKKWEIVDIEVEKQ